jgi:hypothetical protein
VPAEEMGVVTGPQIRVLICMECKTAEQLPDYPPDARPEDDVVLHTVDEKHGGQTQQPHYRTVLRVPETAWKDRAAKQQILDRAFEGVTGFKPSYYDIKDTLQEDAVKCHISHHRQVPCIDYRDASKKLRAPTQKDRDALVADLSGTQRNKFNLEAVKHGAPTVYLCDFCPVQVAVEFKQRQERGEA